MKSALIAGAVVAVALGGLFVVYRYQQANAKDPGQQKQAAAKMPAQPQPSNFQSPQLAYAPGASPLLTQVQQGAQAAGSIVDVAKNLGFFSPSPATDDDSDSA